jgi:hypothetical protein
MFLKGSTAAGSCPNWHLFNQKHYWHFFFVLARHFPEANREGWRRTSCPLHPQPSALPQHHYPLLSSHPYPRKFTSFPLYHIPPISLSLPPSRSRAILICKNIPDVLGKLKLAEWGGESLFGGTKLAGRAYKLAGLPSAKNESSGQPEGKL